MTNSKVFGHRMNQRNKITAGTVPDMLPRFFLVEVSKRSRIVCTNEINNSKTVQSNQSECMPKRKKRRSNTEKFKITKANEYESEKHPIQRFEIVYDI